MTEELDIEIRATHRVSWSGGIYDCDICKRRFQHEGRKIKGCFGDNRVVAQLGPYGVKTCPGNLYSQTAIFVFRLWNEYQRGNLPFPGVITEQPAQILEAFQVIDQLEMERLKQEKKRGK